MTLLLVVALVAVAVVLSPVAVRLFDRGAGWPLGLVLAAAAVVLGVRLPDVLDGEPLRWETTWIPDLLGPGGDVVLSLHGDGLSVFFALLALVIGAVVFFYSAAYLPKGTGNQSFYLLMTAFTLSVVLLVLAGDVFVLFTTWELVSIASFLLIARSGSGGEAGAMRTLILTFFGGLTLLAALSVAAVTVGSTDLQTIFASGVWAERPGLTTLVAVLVATSAFTKAAQFPFHFWLPEAMAAATPVSAFLHAAAVVKAGIYLLLRFSTIFHDNQTWNWLLIGAGLFTAIMSAVFAIQKTDLKQLTAYSTVSHLGWIVATIGVGTEFALAAALTHTLAHALFKSSLFMLIGVVDHQAGTRDTRRLGRLWDRMPFTFVSTTVAAASMAAVPPLFGFLSKESMLTAFADVSVWLVLVAGIAALLTFLYSAKIVLGAFVDGPRDMSHVEEAPVALWLPAALPGWMSVVLIFLLNPVSEPVTAAVRAISPAAEPTHLALWHGVNLPLIVSVAVLVGGVLLLLGRKRLFDAAESRDLLPASGNDVLSGFLAACRGLGRGFAALADSFTPGRHLMWMVMLVVGLAFSSILLTTGVDDVAMAPRAEGLDNPWDLIPLLIIGLSVAGLMTTRSRLTAAVLIGTTGVGMSLQMMLLGAPDVALTQFLVEALTVIVIFLVLRHQPRLFPAVPRSRQLWALLLAVLAGVAAFAAVFALLGRRDRSELAMWYLENGYDWAGGTNIVAIIIVEFRGFDTLGELSVLGMAAVVIAAVVSSVPRHPFLAGTHPRPFGQSQLNSLPLRYVIRLIVPVLAVLSVLIFFRGHNAPGGGFVGALVMATAFGLAYMSYGSDKPVVGRNVPIVLTGVGIIVALSAGFLGLVEGGFLYLIHGEILGEHMTTSLIFDAGIYLAVLGMLTMAINALGGYLRPGAGDVTELTYAHGPDSLLPPTPPVEPVEDADEEFPEPLNPAARPISPVPTSREEN